ncbi:unnamed protein product [Sphagnum compactum]
MKCRRIPDIASLSDAMPSSQSWKILLQCAGNYQPGCESDRIAYLLKAGSSRQQLHSHCGLQTGTRQVEASAAQEQVERLLKPPKPHSSSPWSSGWKKLSRMQIFHHHKEETVMVPHLETGGI